MFFSFSDLSFLTAFRRWIKVEFEGRIVRPEKPLNQRMRMSKFKHDWYKRVILACIVLLCSPIYGEEEKSFNSPKELLTYYEALEKYRETARLEWKLGMGLVMEEGDSPFLMPLLLEVQTPIIKIDERLKWLLQGGPRMAFSFLYDEVDLFILIRFKN